MLKSEQVRRKMKKKIITGIFVDDANLFYAQKKADWRVDFGKLKKLLEKEVKILFTNYYIAIPAKWDQNYVQTNKYLKKIQNTVTVRPKPLKYIRVNGKIIKKGDVDLEISLDVVRDLEKLDLVIIVSGDSDYIELRRYVLEKDKQIIFLGFKENTAWEIKQGKYLLLNTIRKYIELGEKKTPRYYPGRLLLSILYQKSRKKSRETKKSGVVRRRS